MSISAADIKIVLDALQDSDWDEATVVIGDVTLSVARNGGTLPQAGSTPGVTAASSPPVSLPASSALPAAVEVKPTSKVTPVTPSPAVDPGEVVVTAPSIGVFWAAPQPGAAPFVTAGTRVAKGDALCIVEVMKLMNNVTAPVDGVVTAVYCENAESLEYGTPMFSIKADTE